MSQLSGVREFLLAFADDEHLMGQQHTEWIGVAPFLEEDLAFSSIGQDELGHAALLYELVLELDGIEPTDTAVDRSRLRAAEPRVPVLPSGRVHHARLGRGPDAALGLRHLRGGPLATGQRLVAAAGWGIHRRQGAAERRRSTAGTPMPCWTSSWRHPRPGSGFWLLSQSIAPMVPGLCEPVAGEAEAIVGVWPRATTAELLRTPGGGHRRPLRRTGSRRTPPMIR